jgi:hypothetical protein
MVSTHLSVVGRALVRVLPVAQARDPLVMYSPTLGETLALVRYFLPFDPLTEPARDRRVVPGGQPERRERQATTGLLRDVSLAFEGRQYFFVEFR